MASAKNDALVERTVEGSVNYYDFHRSKGTAGDKGLAARLGGHSYNILSNRHEDEIYFPKMRQRDHFVDEKNRATKHFFDRRRKFAPDERQPMQDIFKAPCDHPRAEALQQRRTEIQLAQMENAHSYQGFKDRSDAFGHTAPSKKHKIDNKLYCYEVAKLRPRLTERDEWRKRRGEPMTQTISCPNLDFRDPAGSLAATMKRDVRKEVSQRQVESANFAPWMKANTYANSMDATAMGRHFAATQKYCSVQRLEPYEFSITRKNNHYSNQDKLTRSDAYFMKPKEAMTNNSVKYDIVNNERRWFKYK